MNEVVARTMRAKIAEIFAAKNIMCTVAVALVVVAALLLTSLISQVVTYSQSSTSLLLIQLNLLLVL